MNFFYCVFRKDVKNAISAFFTQVQNMEERIQINNKKDADLLVRQLLNIGEAMYQSGGEISRIEDSLHRLGKAYGAIHVSVYAITSSIVLTAEFSDEYSITQIRRIKNRGKIDCLKMEDLNQLCRDCSSEPIPVSLLKEKVLSITNEKPVKSVVYLGQFIAATSFAIFFGGNLVDAFAAAIGVCVIGLMQQYVRKYFSAELFFNIVVSFATGVVVSCVSLFIPNLHVNQILIGDIMVLIPGIAITNSIRYIFSGDIVSSLEKLMDSLLQAFSIAVGFMLALLITRVPLTDATPLGEPLKSLLQVVFAGIGTLGFCMSFNMRKKHIIIPSIGGLICWASYLFMFNRTDMIFVSTLVSAIIIGIYGSVFSHIAKVPTTIMFIPACVPLIPGGNLYNMALSMISSDWSGFASNFALLALYTTGISFGLAIIGETEKIIAKCLAMHKINK